MKDVTYAISHHVHHEAHYEPETNDKGNIESHIQIIHTVITALSLAPEEEQDEFGEQSKEVGRAESQIVRLSRFSHPEDRWWLADFAGPEMHDLYSTIFKRSGAPYRSVARALGVSPEEAEMWAMFGDLMLVKLVKVDEDHRGKGVGMATMISLLSTFGVGCGLVGLVAAPLSVGREDLMKGSEADQKRLRDIASLSRYWEACGYRRLGRTEFHIQHADPETLPSIAEAIDVHRQSKQETKRLARVDQP